MFTFDILGTDGQARLGRLSTPHGIIETPAFVPVGTQATVRAMGPEDLRIAGTQVIIANTYHLHLRPGEDLIQEMGGLHRFMGWDGPLMTDSGGFQIFSLGAGKEQGVGKIASIFPEGKDRGGHLSGRKEKPLVRVNEEGAEFISYLDGSGHRFTPEGVIGIQRKLGADIILPLDECTSPLHDFDYTRRAMERTHRWALRCLKAFEKGGSGHQTLLGIVQGGAYRDLRQESAAFMASRPFGGYAIGGSLGNSKEDMYRVLEWTVPFLPDDRPRHLLGIGTLEDVFEIVQRGVDTFDCMVPTLMAGTGTLFSRGSEKFRMHILNARFKKDSRPVEEGCLCPACCTHSRAYLRHLFMAGEPLGIQLAAVHNLFFMEALMTDIREAVRGRRLADLKRGWLG